MYEYKVINLQRLSKNLLIYKELLSIADNSGSTVADERIEARNIIFIAENIFSLDYGLYMASRELPACLGYHKLNKLNIERLDSQYSHDHP